ncbi:hypothetical protein L2E82_44197 [Cichorium intybus]|uniref:Uncharacterized protein n=1 Tax=Cichorium intybus TaxID=13427 RepID=A0ACB8ZPT9_CICIN|nr:hypothetical protein L2E82_44197 [Cichorium intybus]
MELTTAELPTAVVRRQKENDGAGRMLVAGVELEVTMDGPQIVFGTPNFFKLADKQSQLSNGDNQFEKGKHKAPTRSKQGPLRMQLAIQHHYEDIYDAKTAVDHLSGFKVANRYLIVF